MCGQLTPEPQGQLRGHCRKVEGSVRELPRGKWGDPGPRRLSVFQFQARCVPRCGCRCVIFQVWSVHMDYSRQSQQGIVHGQAFLKGPFPSDLVTVWVGSGL